MNIWCENYDAKMFPLRLLSNSEHFMVATGKNIALPSDYPKDHLLLQFVVTSPGGDAVAYVRGDVLFHFIGILPKIPPYERRTVIGKIRRAAKTHISASGVVATVRRRVHRRSG